MAATTTWSSGGAPRDQGKAGRGAATNRPRTTTRARRGKGERRRGGGAGRPGGLGTIGDPLGVVVLARWSRFSLPGVRPAVMAGPQIRRIFPNPGPFTGRAD